MPAPRLLPRPSPSGPRCGARTPPRNRSQRSGAAAGQKRRTWTPIGFMRMLLATCAGVAALAGVAPALAAGPAVRVPELTPLTVRGLGFAPGEKVTVSVAWHGMHTKTAVATPVGTFLV